MSNLADFMSIAIEEAKTSLREGNSGFGAAIFKDNALISNAHDTDKTSNDPTAHAEINAIRQAAKQNINLISNDFLDSAYWLFLKKLGITAKEAPIVARHIDRIVIHSKNFCPTQEACKIF